MGIPLVGSGHQRKTSTSQVTDRKLRALCNRVCSTSGSGCSSPDDQQPFKPQKSSSDNRGHTVGALLSGGVAYQGDVHARRIFAVCEELDSSSLGQHAAGGSKDRRGRAMATRNRRDGWHKGQGQVCNVGLVFARRSLGVLWPQPNLVGHPFRNERKERSKYWRSRQREAPASTPCLVAGTSKAWSREAGIPRPITCVSGRSVRDTPGRTRRAALVGLQFRQHELQRSAFLLLAQRRAFESHQDRGVGESIADAFGAQGCPAGMEIAERLQRIGGFCFSVSSPQRQKAARPCGGSQEEDPTSLCGDRHHRRGLAYFPTHGRFDAGRDGGTSAHHPRLLAAQQSACDEQVSSGNSGKQAPGAGEIGGGHPARGFAAGDQIDAHSIVAAEEQVPRLFEGMCCGGSALGAYWTQTDPDFFEGLL